jgi:hypothetical protein
MAGHRSSRGGWRAANGVLSKRAVRARRRAVRSCSAVAIAEKPGQPPTVRWFNDSWLRPKSRRGAARQRFSRSRLGEDGPPRPRFNDSMGQCGLT